MSRGHLFCDGGARGNPGPAGAGAVLYDDQGRELASRGKYIGSATNNVAEYWGVVLGLALARGQGLKSIHLNLDSELVVRQLKGEYRVRHPGLQPLWREVKKQLCDFDYWEACHIPRNKNTVADRLVNEAIDRRIKE